MVQRLVKIYAIIPSMIDSFPTPEGLNLKQQAVEAYKKFVERGITDPNSLDLSDPEVVTAHKLFDAWQEEADAKVAGNREAEHELNFEKTIFYYEIGFTDPEYLVDLLDFLDQDLENVDENSDQPLPELARKIFLKKLEINKKIFAGKVTEKIAHQVLQSTSQLTALEQESLVERITDPFLSFEILTVDSIEMNRLTQEQKEKLMTQILEDEDVAQSFYLQLVESGVAQEPNEIEKWWLGQLERLFAKTDNPEYAAYALEHNKSLSSVERKRLTNIVSGE